MNFINGAKEIIINGVFGKPPRERFMSNAVRKPVGNIGMWYVLPTTYPQIAVAT